MNSNLTVKPCPICLGPLDETPQWSGRGRFLLVDCQTCGTYEVSDTAWAVLPQEPWTDAERAAIAFNVRRMTDRAERPAFTMHDFETIKAAAKLPRPERQLDEAILWVGKHSEHIGQSFDIEYPQYRSILGAWSVTAFNYMTEWMHNSPYFSGRRERGMGDYPVALGHCMLTPDGWDRYRQLSDSQVGSLYAFMAMQYGDPELDSIVKDHFAAEVNKTGFELRRLDQGLPAGSIDDHMRVAIRTSRLLVCDLTHGNRGAYWEAGFAEGLGKPVVYTCRSDVFKDRSHPNHPHFDTNHLQTIIWDPASPADAARRLKDTIRATLPHEAKLKDDD